MTCERLFRETLPLQKSKMNVILMLKHQMSTQIRFLVQNRKILQLKFF